MSTTNGRSLRGCLGLLQAFRQISGYQREVLLEWLAKPENDKWDHSLTEINLEGLEWLERVAVG